jgi:hypothetical protein
MTVVKAPVQTLLLTAVVAVAVVVLVLSGQRAQIAATVVLVYLHQSTARLPLEQAAAVVAELIF